MSTICGVCGKKLKMINNVHLDYHGLTSCEYDKHFPLSENARYPKTVRRGMGIKTAVNHELFNNFTNENTWLIGLLTADGSYGGKRKPNVLQLYSTEKGLIDEFKRQTNTQSNIRERQGLKGQLGKKIVYHLAINSMDIADKLRTISAYGPKSERNPFQHIPEEYKWSFIKGLFDGDGNCYKGFFNIAGRMPLISEVYKWICKQIQKQPNKIYHSTTTEVTVYFQFGKFDSERIFHLMDRNTKGTYNSSKYKTFQAFYEVGDGMELF